MLVVRELLWAIDSRITESFRLESCWELKILEFWSSPTSLFWLSAVRNLYASVHTSVVYLHDNTCLLCVCYED